MSRVGSATPTSSTSRGSYPSRQRRFGPAPLASFEDLPTDECQSSSEDEKPVAALMACPQISLIITDHNQVEHPLETVHLPFSRSDINHSLNTAIPPKDIKRKGSWTDVFSMRKSPTPTKPRERKFSLFNFNFFTAKGKSDADCELHSLANSIATASSSGSTQEIRVQLGNNFADIRAAFEEQGAEPTHDLTPTNVEPLSLSFTETVVHVQHTPQQQPYSSEQTEDDNETIVDSESLHSGSCCSLAGPTTDCCSETEPECVDCRRCERLEKSRPCSCELDTDCCNAADNEDNDEETERPLAILDEGELECLLTGDELEQNSHLPVEGTLPTIPVFNFPNDSFKANFKMNTDILKTSPIDRPRSITPINMNSFESYISQCSPAENVPDSNRLTIKIPGLLYPNQRSPNRFTRKSNPHIWQEFCEKGLKSPQVLRKRANSCFPELNQNCYLNEAFSPENLTPITPIKDMDGAEDRFDDNFWDYLSRSKSVESDTDGAVRAALNNLRKMQSSCKCECNSSSFASTTAAYNLASVATCSEMSSCSESSDNNESTSVSVPERASLAGESHEDEPLMSPCDCICHRASHSLHQFSLGELSTSLGTNVCPDSRDNEAVYDSRNTEDDLSQLSSSTLSSSSSSSSSSSTATSTSQSIRLLDASVTSHIMSSAHNAPS